MTNPNADVSVKLMCMTDNHSCCTNTEKCSSILYKTPAIIMNRAVPKAGRCCQHCLYNRFHSTVHTFLPIPCQCFGRQHEIIICISTTLVRHLQIFQIRPKTRQYLSFYRTLSQIWKTIPSPQSNPKYSRNFTTLGWQRQLELFLVGDYDPLW